VALRAVASGGSARGASAPVAAAATISRAFRWQPWQSSMAGFVFVPPWHLPSLQPAWGWGVATVGGLRPRRTGGGAAAAPG
jgi:hypothetical protein